MVVLLPSCFGHTLTPGDVDAHGTRAFSAPYATVFAASQSGLVSVGYEIAQASEGAGIIKTDRRLVKAVASGGGGVATAQGYYRMYVLRLEDRGNNEIVVRAEPRMFQGAADISGNSIWAMDGPAGEIALWDQLFREIQDSIDMGIGEVTHQAGPVQDAPAETAPPPQSGSPPPPPAG
jgi:hypothetical protein